MWKVLAVLVAAVSVLFATGTVEPFLEVVVGFVSGEDAIDDDASVELPSEDIEVQGSAFDHGVMLAEKHRFKQSFHVFERCSKESRCLNALGESYLTGAGVARNLTLGLELINQAAELGDPDAQYNMGILHSSLFEDNATFVQNEALSVLYLYAASTSGHTGALMSMGYRHMEGYGVPKSCSTAALNYVEVAKQVTEVYSVGMPQAVELIRLNLPEKNDRKAAHTELYLYMQMAEAGDVGVAAAVGKRYLLGIEGFKQNYKKALQYLKIAADQNHGGALALLGYTHCLGLGVRQNLDTAYSFFVSASLQSDPYGHNGLGYIYFHGTSIQARNLKLAFHHFNESAYGGCSDGMFNLASMYLKGIGTTQSFQRAVLWYTQALDRGHTPAAYSLAIMHLNGVGTVRDCDIAVNLLKTVCERGLWVTSKLQQAYQLQDARPDLSAWMFLKLAETGHEVAQMNVAHIFDHGSATLLHHESVVRPNLTDSDHRWNKIFAQRFYEMSAEQKSASSELRLGDYAFYGYGLAAEVADSAGSDALDDGEEVRHRPQGVDYDAALMHYRKTTEVKITGQWMQPFVAQAAFNLGYMYELGIGVSQDLHMAKRFFNQCLEVNPSADNVPAKLMLILNQFHAYWIRVPHAEKLMVAVRTDGRCTAILACLVGSGLLLMVRVLLANARPPTQRAHQPVPVGEMPEVAAAVEDLRRRQAAVDAG
mmetsp:Transcript_25600/g.58157  ORF Transcript_25600/g.58157 Transcript_25600/m.58157 type:complete len:708 (+) Transcript_25600:93-2216(+)